MAENTHKKPISTNKNINPSNAVRSFLFMVILVCLGAFLIMNLNQNNAQMTEVPISEVIRRANDANGDIAKITVTGNELEITLKGKERPTEKSRKDGSGTLYDQGLVNHCEDMEGESLIECEKKYPTIEFKEEVNGWGIALDIALTVLPIIALVIFFSWMMKQATAAVSGRKHFFMRVTPFEGET